MSEKPKRRWFQYSLRTMFVVVTMAGIACGWLGWQLKAIHERRAVVVSIESVGGRVYFVDATTQKVMFAGTAPSNYATGFATPMKWRNIPSLPFWRRWMGDVAVIAIELPIQTTEGQVTRAQEAFPEADVRDLSWRRVL